MFIFVSVNIRQLAGAFIKSDLEILLSTMNRNSLDFLIPMFPFGHFSDFNILIINQTTPGNDLFSPYPSVRVVNAYERGLSRSRNMLLQHAKGKIGIIADDDLVYIQGFDEKIVSGFNHFPKAAVVKFMAVTFQGSLFQKYAKEPLSELTKLQRLNSMSIELGLNINLIKQSGITFNENFGLGAVFPLGEEPVLINELYKAGYAICHYPEVIVSHKAQKDSDNVSLTENYRTRGAYFYQIFGNKFPQWIGLQLLYNLKSGKVKPWQVLSCIKWACKGKNQLKSIYENNA